MIILVRRAKMRLLEQWAHRPSEEANLFGPSFLCALIYEFVKNFVSNEKEGATLFMTTIALTTSLHRSSRERLPYSTVTSLYAWVQENEDLLVGFAHRSMNVGPYIKEGVLFGLATKVLVADDASILGLGAQRAAFPKAFVDDTTPETRSIIERTRFMGRWFAKSGTQTSIAAALGVRP
jgi:hypothetical protein